MSRSEPDHIEFLRAFHRLGRVERVAYYRERAAYCRENRNLVEFSKGWETLAVKADHSCFEEKEVTDGKAT